MSSKRRLGLLGGSFDPVHSGHLHAARAAQAAFHLDRVVFVPAARPPHKPDRVLAGGPDRLAMLELAIAGEPTWFACGLELERAGPSFTIDTVRALPAATGEPEDAEVFMILGTDNLAGLLGWREVTTLLEVVQPVVVFRAGDEEEVLAGACARLSEHLARKLERGYLRLPPARGRSTDLRERLAAGADPGPEIPPAVREYIARRGLYRGS